MMAALNRLDKILARIQSRIDKLEARGIDTSSVDDEKALAEAKKVAAENAINDAKAKIAAIDPASSTVRSAVQTANQAVRNAKKALQEYHRSLKNIIAALKQIRGAQGATESAD
jgi:chromosome segregation ATPase